MTLLFLALALLQGIPVGAGQGGTVSGVLRGQDGKPLPYVRVAAVSSPETINDDSSAAMAGLAETDEDGRFSIQGIPQGRYYIAAGRVDFPTYFPGTQDMAAATILSIMPGTTTSRIDFVMTDSSVRTPGLSFTFPSSPPRPPIPIQVRVEGGGKVPVFSDGKFTTLQFGAAGLPGSRSVPISATSFDPNLGDFEVRVDGLPENYILQSLTFDSVDLRTQRLTLPRLTTATAPTPPIILVLKTSPPPPSASGVRVTGRVPDKRTRSIYLSGTPGTYYADGTFEFRGVQPGKHILAALDTTIPLGAIVVVGERDVAGIDLKDDTTPVPFNMRSPQDPEPAGDAAPGTVIPLASVRGTLLEETSQKPIIDTDLKITGYAKTDTYIIDANGRFHIPRLFPGTYKVEVEIFGHSQVLHNLTVGTENITLDLTTKRLY